MTRLQMGELLFDPTEDSLGKLFLASAFEGLWPWNPDTVELYNEFSIDYNQYKIVVAARKLSWGDWEFYAIAYVDRDDILDYPTDPVWSDCIFHTLVRAFRGREAEPIPDNIILGEN